MRKARSGLAQVQLGWQRRPSGQQRVLATTSVAVESGASSAEATTKSSVQLPPRLATRNLLKASSSLAQRSITHPEPWESSVKEMMQVLEEPRRPVVAFCGDKHSGARDIVTALLEDPLSDDQVRRSALVGRHDSLAGRDHPLRINYADDSGRSGAGLALPIPWLQRAQADILEVQDEDLTRVLPNLLTTDHIILVTDNIRFLSQPHMASLVRTFSHHPSAQILLNRIVTSTTTVLEDEAELGNQLKQLLYHTETAADENGPPTIRVNVMSSTDALDALDIFRSTQASSSSSASAKAVSLELYQKKYLASCMSTLSSRIIAAVQSSPQTSPLATNEGDTGRTQSRTAVFLVSRILHACHASLSHAQAELSNTQRQITSLRAEASRDCIALEAEFAGGSVTKDGNQNVSGETWPVVTQDVARSELKARQVLDDEFSWWKLPFGRVDDVGNVMRDVVMDEYGKQLEKRIVFLSGELFSLQRSLSNRSSNLISFPSSSPFHSPILINTVAQQSQIETPLPSSTSNPKSLPSYTSALLSPLHARQAQILSNLIPQLHSRAQALTLQVHITTLTSAGGAWLGWISGAAEWMTGEVALGIGALGVLSGVRWSMGRWVRAKKRFWDGWRRVGEGLGRDLKTVLDDTMDSSVTKTQQVACDGLEDLVDSRARSIQEIQAELEKVAQDLKSLQDRLS